MSLKKISKEQPSKFEFNKKNLEEANKIIKNYPEGKQQSAVMPLLYLAQKQNDNWIPLVAMKYIGKFLSMPYIKVYEVATFYTMFNLSPVGKYFFQICTTTPCMIRGAYNLVDVCKKKISENESEISKDGKIFISDISEVRWLGAWVPGTDAGDLPEGTGIRVEAGSKLLLQVHYNSDTSNDKDRELAARWRSSAAHTATAAGSHNI